MMEEEVLFKIELNQGTAIQKLESLSRSIDENKTEIKELNAAFKSGQITAEEYYSEQVRIDQILRKEKTTYNELTKQVQGHKSQTDKLIESNNKLSKSMNEGLNNATVFGTNLGGLKASAAALLNPFTAAAAGVSALGSLYASSTIGAKDLEFAQNQLAAATNILGNSFAKLFSSEKDGEGFISTITNGLLFQISPALASLSNISALNQEQLEDLNREATQALTNQQNLLEDNADIMEKIANSQTDFNEKIALSNDAIQNVHDGAIAVREIREQELAVLEQQLALDSENENLQDAILSKKLQIAQEARKEEKLVSNIEKLQSNIKDAEEKRLQTIAAQNEKLLEQNALKVADAEFERLQAEIKAKQAIEDENAKMIASVNIDGTTEEERLAATLAGIQEEIEAETTLTKEKEKGAKASKAAAQTDKDRTTGLMILSQALGGVATLFKESTVANKVFSAAQAGINSFLAGTQVLRDDKLPTFAKIPAMIAIIGAGLAQQAKILGAFAEGGLIQGFAGGGALSGTRISSRHGRPIRRSNGDNLLATVKTGEVILNERQQAMLGGSRTFKAIGVPGFETGGVTGLTATTIARNSESRTASNELFNAISKMKFAVSVEDINLGQQRVDVVESMATFG